jgi:hypothetical protein
VSDRLRSLGDHEIVAVLGTAAGGGAGIGGATASLRLDGDPLFVKRVPLTDLERRNAGSTANLFSLPMFYHYGIGSAGFGVWREVAAHTMTTDWILTGRFQSFPILYHWRVLPQQPAPLGSAEIERWVARWDGSAAVRARLEAMASATETVVLFMEHVPYTVDSWLAEQTAAGDPAAAYAFVDRELLAGVEFMESADLVHFDAHFRNLLTDGNRVYFADLGLATSSRFELDEAESEFVRRHASYDRCFVATHLCHWLVSNLVQIPWADADVYLRDYLNGRAHASLPASAAGIVERYAPLALSMADFYRRLQTVSKLTPYPADELARALRSTSERSEQPD